MAKHKPVALLPAEMKRVMEILGSLRFQLHTQGEEGLPAIEVPRADCVKAARLFEKLLAKMENAEVSL